MGKVGESRTFVIAQLKSTMRIRRAAARQMIQGRIAFYFRNIDQVFNQYGWIWRGATALHPRKIAYLDAKAAVVERPFLMRNHANSPVA